MKAAAYAHACGDGHSPEIEKLRRIDRFGLEAITGRKVFYYGEYLRLIYTENLIAAYQSRAKANNWTEWAASHPEIAAMLAEAEKLYAISIGQFDKP